jgi:hypothetical protein
MMGTIPGIAFILMFLCLAAGLASALNAARHAIVWFILMLVCYFTLVIASIHIDGKYISACEARGDKVLKTRDGNQCVDKSILKQDLK